MRLVHQGHHRSHREKTWTKAEFSDGSPRINWWPVASIDFLRDESNGFKINDKVIIEADIVSISPKLIKSTNVVRKSLSSESLLLDLSRILISGDFSDMTIMAGKPGKSDDEARTFKVHSLILRARSAYFRAMLDSQMIESSTLHATEPAVQPAVFEEVLKYLYTNHLSDGALEQMGEDLLLAADKYGCEDLKLCCEGYLFDEGSLTVGNVTTRLILASQVGAIDLKKACLELIKLRTAEVMQTDGWSELAKYMRQTDDELLDELIANVAGISLEAK